MSRPQVAKRRKSWKPRPLLCSEGDFVCRSAAACHQTRTCRARARHNLRSFLLLSELRSGRKNTPSWFMKPNAQIPVLLPVRESDHCKLHCVVKGHGRCGFFRVGAFVQQRILRRRWFVPQLISVDIVAHSTLHRALRADAFVDAGLILEQHPFQPAGNEEDLIGVAVSATAVHCASRPLAGLTCKRGK